MQIVNVVAVAKLSRYQQTDHRLGRRASTSKYCQRPIDLIYTPRNVDEMPRPRSGHHLKVAPQNGNMNGGLRKTTNLILGPCQTPTLFFLAGSSQMGSAHYSNFLQGTNYDSTIEFSCSATNPVGRNVVRSLPRPNRCVGRPTGGSAPN